MQNEASTVKELTLVYSGMVNWSVTGKRNRMSAFFNSFNITVSTPHLFILYQINSVLF